MVRQKQIKPHEGTTGIYVVVTPYSSTVPLTDMELLGEMNPYATLSHFTALTLHRLTNQFPNELYATVSRKQLGNEVPVGTTVDDWEDVAFRPLSRRPKSILSKGVIWSVTTRHNQFGIIERSPYGFPIRLTDLERTIIDAIDSPSKCGGIYSVLEAWKEASSSINVDVLVKYVEQYGKKLLRQRVGYLMEEVGLSHSILNEWKRTAIRGSSAKLNGEQPFSSIYSEDWSLSLNGPVEILRS
jgi:predicted transcriptional regulator of viral defense system